MEHNQKDLDKRIDKAILHCQRVAGPDFVFTCVIDEHGRALSISDRTMEYHVVVNTQELNDAGQTDMVHTLLATRLRHLQRMRGPLPK